MTMVTESNGATLFFYLLNIKLGNLAYHSLAQYD